MSLIRLALVVVTATGGLCTLGCSDPASQRRIRTREQHFRETWLGVERMEAQRQKRLTEAMAAVKRWHRQDEKRFAERSARIGDYFW